VNALSEPSKQPELRELCEILPWDSAFFGVRIGQVTASALGADGFLRVKAWAQNQDVRCVYFLADARDTASLHAAAAAGFCFVDVRMTFGRVTKDYSGVPTSGTDTRLHVPADLPGLRALARSSYHDSRFYQDPHFASALCDALYERWIERSSASESEEVFVTELDGYVSGFVACELAGSVGNIGLVGVDAKARGHGIGTALIGRALTWFAERGCTEATVVTQGRNASAQRLYQRCGFVTREVHIWYHGWFDCHGNSNA
jgi:dTDP-4-amino-4,6-dideoxy-D-galactose acyltransferase